MSAEWIAAIAALLGSALLYLEVALLRRQGRQLDIDVERIIASRWDELRHDWQLAILVARGPDDYYVDASSEQIMKYQALVAERVALNAAYWPSDADAASLVELVQPLKDDEQIEEWHVQYTSLSREARQYELSVRAVLRFLDWLSLLVLRGRIASADLYAIVGIDFVRNSAPLKRLAEGSDRVEQPSTNAAWWTDYYPGMRQRVLILLDVLWAEAARLRDLDISELAGVARHKRSSGSGLRNRRRIGRWARLHGTVWLAVKLRRHLRHAERSG